MRRLLTTQILLIAICTFANSMSWEGNGTESNPYLISTSHHLAELADEVNNGTSFYGEYFTLTKEIDLSDVCSESLGSWTPIGSTAHYFEGSLSGNNFTIRNLYLNSNNGNSYFGLFGCIGEHATISDLTLQNGTIYSTAWSGGIAGANNGVIQNCHNINCDVKSWQYAGGICGANFNSIINCSNQSDVNSTLCSGGICSYNYGSIIGCSNKNSVTANNGCGGICGYNGGFSNISNCYGVKVGFIDKCLNEASVYGIAKIGGISGRNDGMIINSGNRGEITGSQEVGGIAGYNGGFDGVTGNISNAYNTGNVVGKEALIGGIIGYGNSASEIFNVYTYKNTINLSTPITQYVGEEVGIKENCHILSQEDDLDSLANELNNWITLNSDQSYSYWKVNNNNLFPYFTQEINYASQDTPSNATNIYSGRNQIFIYSPLKKIVHIYNMLGQNIKSIKIPARTMIRVDINKGIYWIDNKKIIVY